MCEARYLAKDRGERVTRWYAGGVCRVDAQNGLYDVLYDDGDHEEKVPGRFLRRPSATEAVMGRDQRLARILEARPRRDDRPAASAGEASGA